MSNPEKRKKYAPNNILSCVAWVGEEGSEIAQMALRSSRFGLYSRNPEKPFEGDNVDLLLNEVEDLLAATLELRGFLIDSQDPRSHRVAQILCQAAEDLKREADPQLGGEACD